MFEWPHPLGRSRLMIVATMLALALFGGHQTITRHHQVGGWTVSVVWDRFTGEISCTVRKDDVELQNDVLVFHSPAWVDTSDAIFRIDGGAARSVHEATYEDQRRGYYREGGPLANPSRGEVALPTHYVTNAKWVWIRPDGRHAPDGFDVRRFPDALELARAEKCPGLGP
jgi:hypothetical protein